MVKSLIVSMVLILSSCTTLSKNIKNYLDTVSESNFYVPVELVPYGKKLIREYEILDSLGRESISGQGQEDWEKQQQALINKYSNRSQSVFEEDLILIKERLKFYKYTGDYDVLYIKWLEEEEEKNEEN